MCLEMSGRVITVGAAQVTFSGMAKKELGVIKAVKCSTGLTNALPISHDQRITLDHFKFGCRNLKSFTELIHRKSSCLCLYEAENF